MLCWRTAGVAATWSNTSPCCRLGVGLNMLPATRGRFRGFWGTGQRLPALPRGQQPAGASTHHDNSQLLKCASPLLQFQAFEVQRCTAAKEGQSFTVEVCVMTTATYGEKFRPLCKYT